MVRENKMKKIVLSSVLLGMMGLFAQEVSCVEFASMSDNEANQYITQFQNEITVIGNDDNKDTKDIVRSNYLKNNSKVAHRHKCMLFRKAYQSPINTLDRVKSLSDLNKEKLNIRERRLYKQLLKGNIQYFSGLKEASLVQADLCQYPILYLSSESTSKGLLIYEKRLVNHKIKTFHTYLNRANMVVLACGSRADIGNKYLSYLNQQGANLPLIPVESQVKKNESTSNDIYSNNFSHSNSIWEVEDNLGTFEVKKAFKAVDFRKGTKKIFRKGVYVVYEKSENGEIFFSYNGVKYRATKHSFEKSVPR